MADNPAPTEGLVERLRRQLHEHKGNWTEISRASGVPYWTLAKIAQGVVTNPRTSTSEALREYFDRQQAA